MRMEPKAIRHSAGAATTAGLLCALLCSAQRAWADGGCPSFQDLGQQLDRKVAEIIALKPGLPLKDFTDRFARPALNFWDNVGSDRETVFFVMALDGDSQVVDQLVCRFDQQERLQRCTRECCRHTSRTITEEQYNSLVVGELRREVERRLCSPSDVEGDEKDSNRISTYYHIDLPVGHHDEGQAVKLIFQDARLSSKDMNPYY